MSDEPRKPPWLREPEPIERLRHCRVTADEHGRVPALLLEWRQTTTGWEARVVRPVLDVEDEKWRPREEWLPAEQLEQPPEQLREKAQSPDCGDLFHPVPVSAPLSARDDPAKRGPRSFVG